MERQQLTQNQTLSMEDFVDLAHTISWATYEDLPEDITINNIPLPESSYRDAFVTPLNPPVHDLVLYLPSTPLDEYPLDRMVYHSDQGFTPLDIFGAIHTYYMMDVPNNVLEQMVRDGVANAEETLTAATARHSTERRISVMGDRVNFVGLIGYSHSDGYEVALQS